MSFYMNFGVINEGEQADAYKKKKRDEKITRSVEDSDRARRREYSTRDDIQFMKHADAKQKELGRDLNNKEMDDLLQYERDHRPPGWYNSYADKVSKKSSSTEYWKNKDAINRHNRRHPDRKVGNDILSENHKNGIFAETYFIN